MTIRSRGGARAALLASSLLLLAAAAAPAQETVRYTVSVDDPSTKLLHVTAEFPATGDELLASLPAWTPGSSPASAHARTSPTW